MTSYSMFLEKHTSTNPIRVKIGMIVYFDAKKSHKKFQTDSDSFGGVMIIMITSSDYDVTSYTNDVITPSKMSESVWIFFVTFKRRSEQ